jgi:AcrR family transcriptional regulator
MVTYRSDTAVAIFEAAMKTMLEQGDAGLRVDAVAAAAGCNKRLIYHYFGDRESLIAAVYQQQCLVLRSAENGLSESTRHFLDQQLQKLWPDFASSEDPQPDLATRGTASQELNRALLLLVPLLLRGFAREKGETGAAGFSASEWQKVSAEVIVGMFAADSRARSNKALSVSKHSRTASKPRYRMASASRVVD